jgi:hypothetical protein
MRKHGRLDNNHHELAGVLRSVGWKFKSTASLGDLGDGIAQRGYDTKIVEFKHPKTGKLTERQRTMIERDGWIIYVIRTVEDALNL